MPYKEYRNIEATLIDYITTELVTDGWTDVTVGKTFRLVNDVQLPIIVLQLVSSTLNRKEVGSGSMEDTEFIIARIFAKTDGQRLDLAKWLIGKLQDPITYYEYVITSGVVSSKAAKGNLRILKIVENLKELEGVADLASEDRYRHKVSFNVKVSTTS